MDATVEQPLGMGCIWNLGAFAGDYSPSMHPAPRERNLTFCQQFANDANVIDSRAGNVKLGNKWT